jgi:hypothetical protein
MIVELSSRYSTYHDAVPFLPTRTKQRLHILYLLYLLPTRGTTRLVGTEIGKVAIWTRCLGGSPRAVILVQGLVASVTHTSEDIQRNTWYGSKLSLLKEFVGPNPVSVHSTHERAGKSTQMTSEYPFRTFEFYRQPSSCPSTRYSRILAAYRIEPSRIVANLSVDC